MTRSLATGRAGMNYLWIYFGPIHWVHLRTIMMSMFSIRLVQQLLMREMIPKLEFKTRMNLVRFPMANES